MSNMMRILLWSIFAVALSSGDFSLNRRLLSSDSGSGDDSDSVDTPSPVTPSPTAASSNSSDSDSDSASSSGSGTAGSDSDSLDTDTDDDDDSDSMSSSGGDESDSIDFSDSVSSNGTDSDSDSASGDDSDDSDSVDTDTDTEDDSDSGSASGDDSDSVDTDTDDDDDDDSDSGSSGGDDSDSVDTDDDDDSDSDGDDDDSDSGDDDDDDDSDSDGDDDDDSDSDGDDDDDSDSDGDDDDDSDSDDDDSDSSDDDDSTPSPVTPAPVTPAPVTPAPVTPAPVTVTTTTSTGTPEPTGPTTEPTPAPTNILLDSVLSAGDEVEGSFSNENASQVDFTVEADPDYANSLCTIDVSGANLTITMEDGTVILYVDDGSSGAVVLSEGQNYSATVWQTNIADDDWLVSMECNSAAPTTEPTKAPTTVPSAAPTTLAPTTLAPSLLPTMAPTYEICDTNDSLNIGFLMDESGSVDSDEWDVMVEFVSRIATYDVAGPSYVAMWEFASLVGFKQFLDFTEVQDDRSGVTTITDALDSNNYVAGGTTETWDAVNRVMDDFWHYRKNCTDGCDTRNDILFVFTDGTPTTQSGHSVCPDMIARVNSSDIDIVVVALSETEADIEEWLDDVTCLDYANNEVDIFKVTEFTDAAFRELEGLIRNKTCNGLNPAGESDRGGDVWVYEDGSTGLGPVPTASGDGSAPVDPDGFSFGAAMNALLENENAKEQFGAEEAEDEASAVRFENVEISLSPFALMNLWAMALLALCVNAVLIVRCMMKRRQYEVDVADRDYAVSDMVETDVDF